VNVNTASSALLQYASGLSKTVANNIVTERNESGKCKKRSGAKKIARLGEKTHEQGNGFIRIIDGDHPLDRMPIHPESYHHTEKRLQMIHCNLEDIGTDHLREKMNHLDKKETAKTLDI